jgi:hypothetical protein
LATAGHLRISYHISHHESFKPYTEAIVLHWACFYEQIISLSTHEQVWMPWVFASLCNTSPFYLKWNIYLIDFFVIKVSI